MKRLHAQVIKDDPMNLSDLTMKEQSSIELSEIFDDNNQPKWDQIKKIDVNDRCRLHRKRPKQFKARDKSWQKKDDYFEYIDRSQLNDINTRIVVGYLFKLCQQHCTTLKICYQFICYFLNKVPFM